MESIIDTIIVPRKPRKYLLKQTPNYPGNIWIASRSCRVLTKIRPESCDDLANGRSRRDLAKIFPRSALSSAEAYFALPWCPCVLLSRVGNLEAGEKGNESARGTLGTPFRLPVVPSAPSFSPYPPPHPLGASAEERVRSGKDPAGISARPCSDRANIPLEF